MAYISFQPSDYYNTKLYTGNGTAIGSGGQAITGVGFQPDMVRVKQRDGTEKNDLCDAVRGTTKTLTPNSTAEEVTNTETLTTFGADGFTVGNSGSWNNNTSTYASWNWKAGTTAVPSGGTITPSACSFNTTSGFGIYTYTGNGTSGATIAHGLGKVPTMMFVKITDGATLNWMSYNPDVGNDRALFLNLTNAPDVSATYWNSTTPTSTLFSLGNAVGTNNSGDDYVAYVWTDIQGYSKFGKYLGNGNADGQFIYTGFRPAFLLLKRYSTTGQWMLYDSKRLGYNELNYDFQTTNTNAERTTGPYLDILSNGFKLRNTDTDFNGSGNSILYAAFAEFPIVSSNGLPGPAR